MDNNGQERISESNDFLNEGYRVELSIAFGAYSKGTSFQTDSGHTVSRYKGC